MFVSKLYTDKWTGNRNEENFIENPTWEQIESAISELDGTTKTLVSLEADDGSYMMIGGGNSGKYVVTATLDNENFYILLRGSDLPKLNLLKPKINKSKQKPNLQLFLKALLEADKTNSPEHKVSTASHKSSTSDVEKLIVGGQGVNYPKKVCVDLYYCLLAAKTFTESGQLEPLLTWENENDDSLVTV
ncbi:MAG TPA: Imm1 family immunity protein [Nostocaceae cyanobacterium]|nr:Imm1 family immunity protein [Nostocaceae cyanobacterium]